MAKVDSKELHIMLERFFGFKNFKGNQEAVILSLFEGKDLFVIMPTGGGKSLCYQLPALMLEGTAIIISPLIALMKNQVDAIRNYGSDPGIAHVLNSTLSKSEIRQVKQDIIDKKTKMLYVAPETLTKEENVEFFKDIQISFYAIDEAHCISEWGHDFRPEYRRIRPIVENIGQNVPIMALTATATPKVQHDIQKNLGMMEAEVYKSSFNRSNLYYEVRQKPKKKEDLEREIVKFIRNNANKSGIIYCTSRKQVEELSETLQINNIKSLPYHAGLDAATRVRNQDMFLMEEVDVIVATIAFGMGIDKPDVRFVVHYDMPKSLEGYYQETGRSGRDDGEGLCVAFYNYDDIAKLEKFSKNKTVNEQEIAKQLIAETVAYADSLVCRRVLLLHYFGESYSETNCGNCDNCIHPKPKLEGQEYIQMLLELVRDTKQQFKEKHLINILIGKSTPNIKQFKHNDLKFYGEGCEFDEQFWGGAFRQALIEELIVKDIENYGILKLTPKGIKYIDKSYKIMLVKPQQEEEEDDEMIEFSGGHKAGEAVDKTLFSLLKDLRKKISRKENLPPFVIFQDNSLEDMCIQYPTTIEEMNQIVGVGQGKSQKYGQPFVDVIKRHVEENEIERPQDMVVKSVVNKSALKVYIIQSIDRKLALEDIAISKSISSDELIAEIESIVASGTKIDLNYYIEEYMDPYHVEEIYEYFREAETDSIEEALLELGEDEYGEEEIRLVRIKFFSELGN
ncbi:MAG: DNA helicase RecQ [Bacteroidales bacterium]|jgi:ATP-dependent DNA helicase RecQ|nr:DNA helicase RecQ [Bacteroidales bacterium]